MSSRTKAGGKVKLFDLIMGKHAAKAGRLLRKNPKLRDKPIGPPHRLRPPIYWTATLPGRRLLDYLVSAGADPNQVPGVVLAASLFNLGRLIVDGLVVHPADVSKIISMWDNKRLEVLVRHGYQLTTEDLLEACISGNLHALKMCVEHRVPVTPDALKVAILGGYRDTDYHDPGGLEGTPFACTRYLLENRLVDAGAIERAKLALEPRLKDPSDYYRGVAERLMELLRNHT